MDFADIIMILALKIQGDYSRLSRWAQCNHMSPKSWYIPQAGVRERQQNNSERFKRRTWLIIGDLKIGGGGRGICEAGTQEAIGEAPDWPSARKRKAEPYNRRNWFDSTNKLSEIRSRFFPASWHLDFGFVKPGAEKPNNPIHSSDLQSWGDKKFVMF